MSSNNITPSQTPRASKLSGSTFSSPDSVEGLNEDYSTQVGRQSPTKEVCSPCSSRSGPLTPQQRRHGASFSKITFSTAEFSEERYIYSPGGQYSDLTADESPKDAGFVPFFAIPATRHSACTQTETETHPSASNVQSAESLRPAFSSDKRDSHCSFLDSLLVSLYDSTKPMPTLPGWEEDLADLLAQEDDPFWTEDCTTEPENLEDSVPLGHHSGVLPSTLKRSPARAKGLIRRKRLPVPTVVPASGSSGGCPCGKRSAPKRHLIDPAIIAARADFQYWNAILDGRQLP
ncbi:hypothetical protein PGT21_023864 [Puccinia graminis f. sp. tritici]|uniref:Uncharacterized protein n=1 Tax=Puccinia graminis f. sp. tritici TaxID=56615 RepID=A0A5B0PA21_PUCGR|nr:hypothetical protein PGT21_023864 [Puccinia graminis f. sp. tritici]